MIKSKSFQLLLLILAVTGSFTETDAQNPRPNIVYILADDLGYGDVSCYNENSKIHTPHIDKLAEEGMLFRDAHTSSSVCTPTRYGILTGRYNWRTRLKSSVLWGYSEPLIKLKELTVAELLKQAGYETGFVGKWHLGWNWILNSSEETDVDFSQPVKNGPLSHGFGYSFGFSASLDMPPYVYVENDRPTMIPEKTTQSVDHKGFWRKGPTADDFVHATVLQDLTDKAKHFVEEKAVGSNPFFLYFPLPAPHTPILPTTEFLGKSNTNFYGDFMLQVDDVVGQIVQTLKENGIKNNTLVIFTSDNGCSPRADFEELLSVGHNPSYIYRGYKADIYEGGHRVPFIASYPGIVPAKTESNEVICTTDLLATCAGMLGVKLEADQGVDSYNLWPLFTGQDVENVREATVHHSIDGRFAIRKEEWKLILWPGSGGWSEPNNPEVLKNLPEYQLYNLEADSGEQNNLINDNPEIASELESLLKKYILNGRSTPGPKQQNEDMDNWPQISWMKKD